MKNIVAAILAMAFATFAPVAFADVYVWCYVQVGLPPAATWYYSGASSADVGDTNTLESDFLAHVRARYGGNVTGSHCYRHDSNGEAMRERDSSMAAMRNYHTVVNTRWTWPGR